MLDGKQPHILCINDSPEILDLLRDLLEEEGFRVSTLNAVDRNLDAIVALQPDVTVIDYLWTTSDNEWTFLTMMTMDPRTSDIPVVLCTGAVTEVLGMQRALRAEIDEDAWASLYRTESRPFPVPESG